MACYNELQKRTIAKSVKKYYEDHPEAKQRLSLMYKGRSFGGESFWKGKKKPDHIIEKIRIANIEHNVGGFWYGNVIYPEPVKYCEKFNNNFRERVRAYWNWECAVCGKKETTRARLSVHHIHYDKKMCCNGSPRDVVALCRSCHTATNYNRDLWEQAFTDLIYSEEHNGKSYLTQKEMQTLLDHTKTLNVSIET